MRIIATVGLLALIQQAVIVLFGTDLRRVPNYLPKGQWSPIEGAGVGFDRLTLLAIAAPLSIGLAVLMRRSKFGAQTTAVADNRLAAATLGHSPHRIAALNWVLGSALAGLAGALIVPITGLGVTPLTLLVVPAFAAALLGGFSSFTRDVRRRAVPRHRSEPPTRYVHTPGGGDAFVFVVIIAVATLRGSAIPMRDEASALLRRVGRRGVRLWHVGDVVAARPAAEPVRCTRLRRAHDDGGVRDRRAVADRASPGLAGQVSLGQFAIAGVAGGWRRGRATCGAGRSPSSSCSGSSPRWWRASRSPCRRCAAAARRSPSRRSASVSRSSR